MKKNGFYPMEKDFALVFERLDKNEDDGIDIKEFVSGISPFDNKNNW
mgnify:CR=1 FL=1